jgi:integrase
MHPSPTGMRLYDTQGHRLYLTGSERDAFRRAAEKAPRDVRTYCHTLLYTGCRPSEALALTAERVDFQAQAITLDQRAHLNRNLRFDSRPLYNKRLQTEHGALTEERSRASKETAGSLFGYDR